MKESIRTSRLTKRVLWTVGIVFVYMLGKYLPIATLPTYQSLYSLQEQTIFDNLAMVTGGQFSSLNLFSLGLSPWMTTMILWRFLTLFRIVKSLTSRKAHYYRMLLMLLVAAIQAFGVSAMSDYTALEHTTSLGLVSLRAATILVLIAGSYALMWLGNQNAQRGLGGPTVIIISNMVLTFLVNASSYYQKIHLTNLRLLLVLLILAVFASFLVWITLRVYRAEYRIPIRRISVVSRFVEDTYLPIRLTPAGGMPFMYAMTLMALPPLAVTGLLSLFPNNTLLQALEGQLSIRQLPGILVYIALLFLLSIGFAYFNVDPLEVSENMRKNGDYIVGVRPGKATKAYISFYLNRLTLLGALYTTVMGGLPLLVIWSRQGEIGLALLINNIYIISTLMLGLVEQVHTLRSWTHYKDII